jgi:DNA-binding SARP family transcriptional activator
MTDLRIYLFGMPRIEYQGRVVKIERRKALALVACLALAEQPQSREVLAGLLWPDLDHEHARSALRSTLHTLTTPIPFEWIVTDRTTLELKRDAVWVDVNAFVALLNESSTHAHSRDDACETCVDLFRQAVALYQADLMAGFDVSDSAEYEDWQAAQRGWLRREYADIQCQLSNHYAKQQRYDQAIKHARDWLTVDPLHEPAHRQLMRLYAATGQRSDALRQYQQCVEILDAELVTLPDDETVQLYEAIQANRLPLNSPVEANHSSLSTGIMPPLPALTVGREEALSHIKHRLGIDSNNLNAITVIQGWPGVGKSTMASMLAHDADIAQQFPDGVLWTSLGENPNVLGEISAWVDALMPGEVRGTRAVEEISAQLTSTLRSRRMLLIVDDVWQIEHALPFRVGGQMSAIIMTTRLNDVAIALAPTAADIYRLPVLSEAAALELLGKLAPETVAQHPNEAGELVRDLEGLPLAVRVAGHLLHSEARLGWGVQELLSELRTGANLLQAHLPSDMIGAAKDASPTVAALLKRSTDLLDTENRRRFAYLGLFVPKPATFDLEAMGVTWEMDDPRPVARLLVSRGLLEPITGGRFQMHALLVMHARSLLVEEGYAV